jgi:ABC-type multidrug transport system fused ATPase/permease subunit
VHHAWPLIKRFWVWIRPHQRYVWSVTILLLLSTPLTLVSPLIVRRVVDDAVLRSSPDEVLFWGAVLVGMTAIAIVFGLGIGYGTTLLHTKVLRDLRVELYEHMQRLEELYGQVKKVDLWVGGPAEDHVEGSQLGGLFHAIVKDQFERLRDCDRFWYERVYSGAELEEIRSTTLADVIRRNTRVGSELPDDVFRVD